DGFRSFLACGKQRAGTKDTPRLRKTKRPLRRAARHVECEFGSTRYAAIRERRRGVASEAREEWQTSDVAPFRAQPRTTRSRTAKKRYRRPLDGIKRPPPPGSLSRHHVLGDLGAHALERFHGARRRGPRRARRRPRRLFRLGRARGFQLVAGALRRGDGLAGVPAPPTSPPRPPPSPTPRARPPPP